MWAEDDFLKQNDIQEKVIFVKANENGGFAKGNNIGIQYAMKDSECSYVWLLNNDTVIKPDTLSKLVEYAEQHQVGICGSTLLYYHNPEQVQAYGGHINRFFGTGSHILSTSEIEKKLDYVVGASFLINRKVIEKIITFMTFFIGLGIYLLFDIYNEPVMKFISNLTNGNFDIFNQFTNLILGYEVLKAIGITLLFTVIIMVVLRNS